MKARETEIRFNAFRIEFDRVIQFRKGFLFFVLRKQDAAHQDVTFDVVLILLQDFFGETLSFRDCCGRFLAAHQIVVAELHAHVEIVRVEFHDRAHLFEGFLIALQTFVRLRQSPMCIGELLVDLQRTAKLERGLLKLFVFQQGFATSDVLGFGFFGGRARAEGDSGGNDSDEKQKKG